MSNDIQKIINTINAIDSVEDKHQLQTLDDSVQQLFDTTNSELCIDSLLGIFERFPDEDGYDIFWTILHGLEGLPNYQAKLVKSVQRRPTEFSLTMVNRILNSEQRNVDGMDLLELLKEVASNQRWSKPIRETVMEYIEWQQSRINKGI